MRKLSKEVTDENGDKLSLIYSIIYKNSTYGISVEMLYKNNSLRDFVEIEDITVNLLEITHIFMILYNYDVTPCSVYDVLDTYFADTEYFESII